VLNVVVAVVLTLILRAVKAPTGLDQTVEDDYYSQSDVQSGALPGGEGIPAPAGSA